MRISDWSSDVCSSDLLQVLADIKPESGLASGGGMARYKLQQWLNFIATELHKAVFIPLLDPKAAEDAKAYARAKVKRPLDRLRSEERRVGKECVRTCNSRRSP